MMFEHVSGLFIMKVKSRVKKSPLKKFERLNKQTSGIRRLKGPA